MMCLTTALTDLQIMNDSLTITQQIDIYASRTQVWNVLSDLTSHNDWNPNFQVEEAPLHLETGAQARLCAAPGTPQERMFTVEILQANPPALLEWQGGEPGVFQGMHRFELQEQNLNQTRLINSESFNGEMAVTVLLMSRAVLMEEFAAFNETLKRRVEGNENPS